MLKEGGRSVPGSKKLFHSAFCIFSNILTRYTDYGSKYMQKRSRIGACYVFKKKGGQRKMVINQIDLIYLVFYVFYSYHVLFIYYSYQNTCIIVFLLQYLIINFNSSVSF